jgi:hypothetical protein
MTDLRAALTRAAEKYAGYTQEHKHLWGNSYAVRRSREDKFEAHLAGALSLAEVVEVYEKALEAIAVKPGSDRRDYYGDIATKALSQGREMLERLGEGK